MSVKVSIKEIGRESTLRLKHVREMRRWMCREKCEGDDMKKCIMRWGVERA